MTSTSANEASLTYVYVIGPAGSHVVKLGKADDVPSRLSGLQTGSPIDLVILETFRCEWAVETALHRRYRHLRVRGEWFDFGDLDPVAEVASAVAEIVAERTAERERQLNRERQRQASLRWAPAIVGNRTLVYPSDMGHFPEAAQCVARQKNGRRCGDSLENSQITNPNFLWRVPGYGSITVDTYGYDEADRERWLAQRCRRHAVDGSPSFCDPEWELFDPEKHSDLLGPPIRVIPGFETHIA